MEKSSKALFTEQLFDQIIGLYGVKRDQVEMLDGFESFIYELKQPVQPRILRVSHSSHRTINEIRAEIEWLSYLVAHGLPVAQPLLSTSNNLVEIFSVTNSYFSAVSFVKAKGTYANREERRNPVLLRKLGALMGQMHVLAKDFQPSHPDIHRKEWHEDVIGFAEKFLPPGEELVTRKFNETIKYLLTLPKDRDGYGLIHQDVHWGNFYVDDGEITLFDFDDMLYCWFVCDIAMTLLYSIPYKCDKKEDIDFARWFLDQLLEGYEKKNHLDSAWLKQIPYFMKLREIDLYIAIHRSYDLNDLDPWSKGYMDGRKQRIENDVPFLDLNFG